MSESENRHKKKHLQKFKSDYQQFDGIERSKYDEYRAFCRYCNTEVSIKYGGRDDLRKHIVSKKHIANVKLKTSSKPVSSFFKDSTNTDEVLKIIRAETTFTQFIIDSNLPISTADKAGPLFKQMFPDSKVADKYSCGRTKTSSIIKTLATETSKNIANDLSHTTFSLATDGSNDDGKSQLYPVVVRYFDDKAGKCVCVLLSIPICEGSCTGENIYKVLDNELCLRHVAWKNCISFACDNASVMTGVHKGVSSFIKRENPGVYIQGCACHLIHLAAKHAGKELPVSIDDFLVEIYFYLDKSSKRQKELHQFQNLFGVKPHKILKHVSTRWLSLGACISRLLEQWSALDGFFKAQSESSQKRKVTQKEKPETKKRKIDEQNKNDIQREETNSRDDKELQGGQKKAERETGGKEAETKKRKMDDKNKKQREETNRRDDKELQGGQKRTERETDGKEAETKKRKMDDKNKKQREKMTKNCKGGRRERREKLVERKLKLRRERGKLIRELQRKVQDLRKKRKRKCQKQD